jgi:RHS repeat-associated protein
MPLRVEDASGRVTWQSEGFDAYGNQASGAAPPPLRLRFAGHFYDEDLGLFYNRFRDYDPALARYLQPDPLGHEGGLNLYAYPANPEVEVDLRGLSALGHKKPKKTGGQRGKGNGNKKPKRGAQAKPKKNKTTRKPPKRDDVYPSKFRKSTHDAMAIKHTDEGKRHAAAAKKDPSIKPPPPVRANGGKGKPLRRDQMTWRDSKGKKIPFYKGKDKNGKPITNVTYDHDPSIALQ